MHRTTRRDAMFALMLAACTRKRDESPATQTALPAPNASTQPAAHNADAKPTTNLLTWNFPNEPSGATAAVIVVPADAPQGARFPVVVALHGRGEALKSPREGAMGWPRDYAMTRAIDRLHAPPLTQMDFEGLIDDDRLRAMNAQLAARPYGGLIVACPYLPDIDLRSESAMRLYGKFVLDVFLPRVRRETPALVSSQSTGIDGVSLGGMTALRVGLAHPDAFGAVGALQPAMHEDQVGELTEIALAARAKNRALKLRLTTSHDDYFRVAIEKTSASWRAAGIDHDYADLPGPHDYIFNRGPGSYELLTWHDRVLSRAR
jgi:enterochelin esterase-like enzyme